MRYMRLTALVAEYEKERELPDVGVNSALVQRVLDGVLETIGASQWTRINMAVDAMPIDPRRKIGFTREMHSELLKKVTQLGTGDAETLFSIVGMYEVENRLPQTGLSSPLIGQLISENHVAAEIPSVQWNRLNDAIDGVSTPDAANDTRVVTEYSLRRSRTRGLRFGT